MAGRHKAPKGRRARSGAAPPDADPRPVAPPAPQGPPAYDPASFPPQGPPSYDTASHAPQGPPAYDTASFAPQGPPAYETAPPHGHPAPTPPWAGAPPTDHPVAPDRPSAATEDANDVRPATWWTTMAAACGIALIAVVLGAVLTVTEVIVDWREPVVGAALVLTPFLVWQVVSGVHRRWRALGAAYAALFVLGVGVALAGDLVLPHTVAGFAAAAVGVLAGGVAFVLTSRLFLHRSAVDARPEEHDTRSRAPLPAPATTAPEPFGEVQWQPPPPPERAYDESDTDLLPRMLPTERRNEREDDSLAG